MTHVRTTLGAGLLLLVGGALACVGGPQKPSVEILSPPSGSLVALGEEVSVEYRASDATAVVRVELEVGGAVVGAQNSPVPEGQPAMNGILNWAPQEAGSYTLIVRAYNKDRVASDPVGVSITVGEGEAVPGSTVTISLLFHGGTGTPESSATVAASGATATRPASTPSATSTRPAGAPTATATRPAPTATRPHAAPPPSPTQGPVAAKIELINNSGEEVYFVHFASPFHSFADDQLGSDTVYTNNNYIFNVYAGTYRLQAVASDGFVLDDRSGVNVQGHYDWTITARRQPSPTQVPPARIELINSSGEAVYFVYFGSPYHDFGIDQLGTDIIPAGGNYNWNVLAATYHLRAAASDGYVLSELFSADVHGHYQWVIPQTRQPEPPPASTGGIMLHNDSGQEIWYVFISEAGQSFNYNDDKLGSSVVLPGETYQWTGIPVGYYDMTAWGQQQNGLHISLSCYVPPGDYYHWFVVG